MSTRPLFLFVTLALVVSAVSARAQGIMTATVPFAFLVRGQEFPAGDYEVRLADNGSGLVQIEKVQGKAATFALTTGAAGVDPVGDQPALVFLHRENQFLLSEIWQSHSDGAALPGISTKSKASRTHATARAADDVYVLAANRL